MRSINLSKESQKVFIGKFIAAFSGFIGLIIYANVLGAAGLGLYYIAHAVATISAKPSEGIGIAIENIKNKYNSPIGVYSSVGLIFIVLYSIILSFIALIFYLNSYLVRINTPRDTIVYLTVILFISLCIYILFGRLYSSLGEPGDSVMIDAGKGILETILQVVLLWFGLGVEGLIIGTIIATIIAVFYLLLNTPISFSIPTRTAFEQIKEYSRWSVITSIIQDGYLRMDTILIGFIISPSAVGIYESAMRIVQPAKYMGYSIERPLLVRVSQDKNENVTSLLSDFAPYSSLLAIPLFVGGIFVAEDLLSILYGTEFSSGYYILLAGSIYYAIYAHSNVLVAFIHGLGNPYSVTRSIIISTIVRLIAVTICLYYFGLFGIIPSILFAEVIRFYLLRLSIINLSNYSYLPYKIKYQIISSIVMMIFILPIIIVTNISHPIYLFTTILTGGVIYMITLINIDDYIRTKIKNKNVINSVIK